MNTRTSQTNGRRSRKAAAAVAGAALALAALGGGIAHAVSSRAPAAHVTARQLAPVGPASPGVAPAPASVDAPVAADTDTLQQGDQSAPDRQGGAEAASVTTTSKSVRQARPARAAAVKAAGGNTETANETAGETTGETAAESQSGSDGPGGHQDPAGDVQHEGGASEQ